jgi:hypothetical protein
MGPQAGAIPVVLWPIATTGNPSEGGFDIGGEDRAGHDDRRPGEAGRAVKDAPGVDSLRSHDRFGAEEIAGLSIRRSVGTS